MKQSIQLKIAGKVQGVGFRYFCREKARLHSISGFVKNLPDGSVYAEAEGNPENLRAFVECCRVGPPASRVTLFESAPQPLCNYVNFEIR